MHFIDRIGELGRLDSLMRSETAVLGVLYGRRRVGKTRLLLEWIANAGGVYTVADLSSADIQRAYFAAEIARVLPGFAAVRYPDWSALLRRLAQDARSAGWRGPLVIDELPYWVQSAAELPSVLQRWIDHDASGAGLKVVVAGSSQRMMQGLVLAADAPLYGRAAECMKLRPLFPWYIPEALGCDAPLAVAEFFALWGGMPRYWELAADRRGSPAEVADRLVLDPLGPLHREPERLLLEEMPPAMEVRPVLDAIGLGAHKPSEIAARTGHKATSLSKPLARLLEMDLILREVPFGEPEKRSKTSLYRIADPFLRLWFRMVAPHRSFLATAAAEDRFALFDRLWPEHAGASFELFCRICLPRLRAAPGPWQSAGRWWRGNAPEWDLVAESADGRTLLLGECKWRSTPFDRRTLTAVARALNDKPPPNLPPRLSGLATVRALFVPALAGRVPASIDGVRIHTVRDLLA